VHRGCESTKTVVPQQFIVDSRSAPMPTECSPDFSGFEPVEGRAVVAAFDAGAITSCFRKVDTHENRYDRQRPASAGGPEVTEGRSGMLSAKQFAFLRSIDTPTVCNLIEIVAPERRGAGYTASHLHCPFPDLPPMVGFAKTATIRARDKVSGGSYMQKRMEYLDYVAAAPRPSVVVIEDKDEPAGYGAFWGEVQTNVHKALDCLGTVTNGSVRDIAAVAEGFQMLAGSITPSHAYVHVIDFGVSVTIHSMEVKSGDLIHADRHGAVVVPVETIDGMAAALDGLMKQEARIIAAARAPDATVESIKAAMRS
jgi:regulator of RNase E activity RraA